jgi:hypothetical protein
VNDREHRLRERIDQLTDERDQARTQLRRSQRLTRNWRERCYTLQKQAALWRQRALKRF